MQPIRRYLTCHSDPAVAGEEFRIKFGSFHQGKIDRDVSSLRMKLRPGRRFAQFATGRIRRGGHEAPFGTWDYVFRRDCPPRSVSRFFTNSTITGRARLAAILSMPRAKPVSTSFFFDFRLFLAST